MKVMTLLLLLSLFACNRAQVQSETMEDKSDTTSITMPVDTLHQGETKTMQMTFMEYSEGDYPHLLFKDVSSGEEYDFRHITENKYGQIALLLEDANAAFGVKANPEYLNKVLVVKVSQREVPDYNVDGSNTTTKAWIIEDLQLSQ